MVTEREGHENRVDPGLHQELGLMDTRSSEAIDCVQQSLLLYEQTLRAMGLYVPETASQAVDNSRVVYNNPPGVEGGYADVQGRD